MALTEIEIEINTKAQALAKIEKEARDEREKLPSYLETHIKLKDGSEIPVVSDCLFPNEILVDNLWISAFAICHKVKETTELSVSDIRGNMNRLVSESIILQFKKVKGKLFIRFKDLDYVCHPKLIDIVEEIRKSPVLSPVENEALWEIDRIFEYAVLKDDTIPIRADKPEKVKPFIKIKPSEVIVYLERQLLLKDEKIKELETLVEVLREEIVIYKGGSNE